MSRKRAGWLKIIDTEAAGLVYLGESLEEESGFNPLDRRDHERGTA